MARRYGEPQPISRMVVMELKDGIMVQSQNLSSSNLTSDTYMRNFILKQIEGQNIKEGHFYLFQEHMSFHVGPDEITTETSEGTLTIKRNPA